MTHPSDNDEAIFQRLGLNYSRLAELLDESRQNVRQMITGGKSAYFNLERLQRLHRHFTQEAPDPARADYLAGLLKARLSLLPEAPLPSLRQLTAAPWRSLILSLPDEAEASELLRQIGGPNDGLTRSLYVVVPELSPARREPLQRAGFPLDLDLTVLRWPPAGHYPAQLLLQDGAGQWRPYARAEAGWLPLQGDAAAQLAAAWSTLIQKGEAIAMPRTRAPRLLLGEGLPQAQGGGPQRMEYRFRGTEGDFRLLLEQVAGWGWLLRLSGEAARPDGVLVVEDGGGRAWLRAEAGRLPQQALWDDPRQSPIEAARDGLILRRETRET